MVNLMQKFAVATATIVLGSGGMLPAKSATLGFDGLYVFGDSLSDNGNVYSLTEGQFPPLPYAPGRFTNGPNWIDDLAQELSLNPTPIAQVNLQNLPTQGINFAFGGATTETANTLNTTLNLPEDGTGLPGLQQEVQQFTNLFPKADPQALYIVWAGGNDYLPTNSNGFTPFQTPNQPVSDIISAVQALANQGARNIVIANLPNLGTLPLVNSTPLSNPLNTLSTSHNNLLQTTLDTLSPSLPSGVNLIPLDISTEFSQILANPSQFGFTNVTDSCFVAPDPTTGFQGSLCSNPNQYFFWDAIHPTQAGHQLIAEVALKALAAQSVPEPTAVYALGLLGLGFVVKRTLVLKRFP